MNLLLSSDLRYNLQSPPRAVWSPEENKKFEELIKEIPLDCPHIFEKIARELPSKSILDIKEHYGSLIEGVFIRHRPSFIEVPNYGNSEIGEIVEEIPNKKKKGKEVAPAVEEKPKKKRGMGDQWTKEEHEYVSKTLVFYLFLFLLV
ncbi:transcription factor SRM1 [Quercus suber]|uniref:transcription factor SRM1 n=1 Tax=Quercus suber TaxID=58331 RepID=UPI0032DECAD2